MVIDGAQSRALWYLLHQGSVHCITVYGGEGVGEWPNIAFVPTPVLSKIFWTPKEVKMT